MFFYTDAENSDECVHLSLYGLVVNEQRCVSAEKNCCGKRCVDGDKCQVSKLLVQKSAIEVMIFEADINNQV